MIINIRKKRSKRSKKPVPSGTPIVHQKFKELLQSTSEKGWKHYEELLKLIIRKIEYSKEIKLSDYANLKALLNEAIYLCEHHELRKETTHEFLPHSYISEKDMLAYQSGFKQIKKMLSKMWLDFSHNDSFSNADKDLMKQVLIEPYRYCIKCLNICANFDAEYSQAQKEEFEILFEKSI